jgi:acyl carrier protein
VNDLIAIATEWVRANRMPDADPSLEVTPSTDLLSSGLLDSLAFVDLVAFLEERTGRTIDLAELDPAVFSNLAGLCGAFAEGSPR